MEKVYLVVVESCYDGFTETSPRIFGTEEKARKYFKEEADKRLAEIKDNAEEYDVAEDESEAKYVYDYDDTAFSCWENGNYCEDHFLVSMQECEVE